VNLATVHLVVGDRRIGPVEWSRAITIVSLVRLTSWEKFVMLLGLGAWESVRCVRELIK